MKKFLKLFLLSSIFFILLIPGILTSVWAVNEILGSNSYQNHEYVKSPFYTSDDEIGFLTDYCKKNDFFGRKGTDEEKLANCIDAELRIQPLAYAFAGIMKYVSFVLIPIFILYTWYYFRWIKKNFFIKKK